MSVKSRPFATLALAFGITAGLLLQGAAAQALPTVAQQDPATAADAQAAADGAIADPADDGASDASADPSQTAGDGAAGTTAADADAAADAGGSVADGGDDAAAEAGADPVESADAGAGADPEPADPEPTDEEDPAAQDPDPSDEESLADGTDAPEQTAPEPLTLSEARSAQLLAATTSLSAGFKAGYIVTDGKFYNGKGMTAAQIQSFLNEQVPRCTIGDSGRTAGTPIYGSTVAKSCLKNAKWTTSSRAANAYCKAYTGGSGESSAKVIEKVARACSISPQVLLVMLEKEQSLVTDTWPTVRQFDVAMGYACPDSGPNNSANCDPSQTGFMQQVYRGAWQLQVYKAQPDNYNYKPFKTNTIQWHPDTGCGTSRVYVENWATAALYIYTPYRPNQAALDAGWGTGDACSSYGNRNFYRLYKQWFGSPNTQFPDVPTGHKFFTEIEWMGATGLSTGIAQSNGRAALFKPLGRMTREAMAAFLYRIADEKYTAPKTSPFADLKPGDKFYREITWMYARGYTTGIAQPSGKPKFAPKAQVSREAMAAFAYRMQGATASAPAVSPFADMKPGDPFYKEIAWMRSSGLSTGIAQPSGKPIFAPKKRMSREAMAAFIYRMQH